MARGKTLISMLDDLRAEAKLSLNPAHNSQTRDTQVKTLQHTQEWLWDDFAWPNLLVERQQPLAAGQRYYAPPDDVDIARISHIEVKDGGVWRKVQPGIERWHYSQYDSDLDQRAWPVQRWRITEDEQIEFWPLPNASGTSADLEGYIKIIGIKTLSPLIADDDRCDLDSRLIVLYSAADILKDEKEARKKFNLAGKLYAKLRGGLTPRRTFRMFGIGQEPDHKRLHGPPTVYYRIVES